MEYYTVKIKKQDNPTIYRTIHIESRNEFVDLVASLTRTITYEGTGIEQVIIERRD